jgi:hypothetical protein
MTPIALSTSSGQHDLSTLLSPISLETFFSSYWEKKPLKICHGDTGFFRSLFTTEMLASILEHRYLRFPGVRLFLAGQEMPPSEFTRMAVVGMEKVSDVIDPAGILNHYDHGATIHIIGLERMSGSLLNLTRCLEADLGFPAHATGFLTPPLADNIPAHEDPSDFLILQIGGEKHWRVWDCIQPLPLASESRTGGKQNGDNSSPITATEPIMDITLSSGDVMYVPRGFYHQALTSECYSFHITVVINLYRWHDVIAASVQAALAQLQNSPLFQQALPHDPASPESKQQFRIMLETLSRAIQLDSGLSAVDRHLLMGRYPSRHEHLVNATKLQSLTLRSIVTVRPRVAYQLIENDSTITLVFHNKQVIFPPFIRASLEYILQTNPFVVGEIRGDLTDDEKLVLVRRLMAEGFLTFEA